MADVRPFRAVRYARPDVSQTAPPYDVLDAATVDTFRTRDPHNIVHLTLEPHAEAAGERFRAWLEDGVLVRDETAAVWWLEQDFVGPDGVSRSRSGIVASLRVEPYETRAVLPHERTHAGPIEGRLALLRATRVQLEPIFLLYDAAPPLARPEGRPPELDVDGTRLWRIEGDSGVEPFFDHVQLLIADGHHRYETAVAFAREDGADRMLVVLVSTADAGLEIFPTHRVFTGRPDIDPPGESFATVGAALDALERVPPDQTSVVFVRGSESRLVRGAEDELDVELVDRFGHDGLTYTADRDEALDRTRNDEDCAFILRPLRVEDVFARARAGRTMPQKATYFFPKLVSGLLLHPVDP
ncbi:MAG TPA: DUF1015 domain-containing protein [Gaiella sp.]|nr:DUF1015 domain-containing protein [Gaiella sp.]